MLITGLILGVIMLLAISLNKSYYHVTAKELRHQAHAGDKLAARIYKTAAYGMKTRLLLGAVGVLAAAGSFVFLALSLSGWLAFILIVFLLWLGYLWIPSTRLTAFGNKLGVWCSRPVAWVLRVLNPLLDKIDKLTQKHYPFHAHTGLYDAKDLANLLQWQREQPDNRIPLSDLAIAKNAMTFGEKKVSDILTPLKMVSLVSANENIRPILIDELHKTGHSFFPVYEAKKDNIIGTLYLADLVAAAKQTGSVKGLIRRDVHFVHEDFSLQRLLEAFFKTKQSTFVVINGFEEVIGIVGVNDVLIQIVGQPIASDFDDYQNARAVAETMAKKEHAKRKKADIELTADQLDEDMVE